MSGEFSRTQLIFGEAGMKKLAAARVAVFGIGGVGGHLAEALARSGIGAIDLIDNDTVCESNINRQIIALHSTLGMHKTDAAEKRIHDINPDCKVTLYTTFFLPETRSQFTQYSYIADAIDTVSGKLALAECAQESGVPIISAMGAGNKLDPTMFEVADIYETSVCPLARVMRTECKKRGIKHLKVVYSKEKPAKLEETPTAGDGKKIPPGSVAFVPSVAGLIMAGEIIKDIIYGKETDK